MLLGEDLEVTYPSSVLLYYSWESLWFSVSKIFSRRNLPVAFVFDVLVVSVFGVVHLTSRRRLTTRRRRRVSLHLEPEVLVVVHLTASVLDARPAF